MNYILHRDPSLKIWEKIYMNMSEWVWVEAEGEQCILYIVAGDVIIITHSHKSCIQFESSGGRHETC